MSPPILCGFCFTGSRVGAEGTLSWSLKRFHKRPSDPWSLILYRRTRESDFSKISHSELGRTSHTGSKMCRIAIWFCLGSIVRSVQIATSGIRIQNPNSESEIIHNMRNNSKPNSRHRKVDALGNVGVSARCKMNQNFKKPPEMRKISGDCSPLGLGGSADLKLAWHAK